MTNTRCHRRRLKALWKHRPRDPQQLRAFVQAVLGLEVPAMRGESQASPMDYLAHAFFDRGQDVVVWAPRGGGKTMLGAVATVLDLLFKPGIELRILGGSLEQSQRMYEHVLAMLDRPLLRGLLRGEPTQRRVVTRTGARAAVLSQSQRSVRGLRVQKLRCDEVDMFDPEVWEAAQLVTRSAECAGQPVPGVIEALSTMHVPGGLMSRLVGVRMADGRWEMEDGSGADPSSIRHLPSDIPKTRLIRWTVMDVIERCEPQRPCDGCVLWNDCGGRAKRAAGFVSVDDLVRQWKRSSRLTWDSEMMCRMPAARERVYEEFDPRRHVRAEIDLPVQNLSRAAEPVNTQTNINTNTSTHAIIPAANTLQPAGEKNLFKLNMFLPSQADAAEEREQERGRGRDGGTDRGKRTKVAAPAKDCQLVGGMDFGWRNPTVFLWARVYGRAESGSDSLLVHVIDEYSQQRTRLEDHVAAIKEREHGELAWVGIDPAGGAGNSQTGMSDATVLRRHGFRVRARQAAIMEGVEMVRRLLDHGQLFIHPRCTGLLLALRTYHYDVRRPRREEPVKDGPDHFCDALRYLLTNLRIGGRLQRRDYLYGS